MLKKGEKLVKYLSKFVCLLTITFLFSACNGDYPPIEADDFGYPKFTVYAKGQNVTGEESNQLAEWELTGYQLNIGSDGSTPITIMVYNQMGTSYIWAPWLCGGDDDICVNMTTASNCILASNCTDPTSCAPSNSTCTYGEEYCPMTSTESFCCNGDIDACQDVMYESFPSAPCNLQQGQGLYLLVTNPLQENVYGNNPNTYPNVNKQPFTAGFYTKGLWYPTGSYQNNAAAMGYYGAFEIPNYPAGAPYASSPTDYNGGYAYLKILDRYYDDNAGYFYVTLKTGFEPIVPLPIETVMNFLIDSLNTTAQTIYTNVVNESNFRASLKALLVMYIAVHGILYLGGISDMTQRELGSMFIRLTIVIQLTTATASWNLFNSYFFNFFTGGMGEMVNIVTSNLPNGGTSTFGFFDSLFDLVFSYETNVKIYSLIASFPCGIMVVLMIYIAFAIFILAMAQSVMIYLLAYMAVDLLIIIAPIFISFMLFESTKELFENWLNMFCSYFLQAVVVMAAVSLLGQIIVNYIYIMLGFQACYNDWITVNYSGISFVIMKTWQICPFFDETAYIAVPGYGYNDPSDPSYYCEPYECWDTRYVNLPFLDTDSEASFIDDFRTAPGGSDLNVPMLYDGSILIITCYLMMKFNDVVPNMAKGISGGSFSSAIGDAGRSITQDFSATASGIKNAALYMAQGKTQEEREASRRQAYQMIKRKSLTFVAENITSPFKENIVKPAKEATKFVANASAKAASDLASGAAGLTAATASYLGKGAYKAGARTANLAGKAAGSIGNIAYNTSLGKMAYSVGAGAANFVGKSAKAMGNTYAGRTVYKVGKGTAKKALSATRMTGKAAGVTASMLYGTTKSTAGVIYRSAKAVAPSSVYSAGGFLRDMIIPPGSLMGFAYNPEGAESYRKKYVNARNVLKHREAKEAKEAYDKFHEQRQQKLYKQEKDKLDKWYKQEKQKAENEKARTISKDDISKSFNKRLEAEQERIGKLRQKEGDERSKMFMQAYEREYSSVMFRSRYIPFSYQYMLSPEKAQEIFDKFNADRQAAIDKQMAALKNQYLEAHEKAAQQPGFSKEQAEKLQKQYHSRMHDLSYAHYLNGKKDFAKVFKESMFRAYEDEVSRTRAGADIKLQDQMWMDMINSSMRAVDKIYSSSMRNIEFDRVNQEVSVYAQASKAALASQTRLSSDTQESLDREYKARLLRLKYQNNEKGLAEYAKYAAAGRVKKYEYDPSESGYKFERSHREKLIDLFKKKTGYDEIERRAAAFDKKRNEEYGDSLGMAIFKAGLSPLGKFLYSTNTGKKIYDAAAERGAGIVSSIRKRYLDEDLENSQQTKTQEQLEKLARRRERKERIRAAKNQRIALERQQKASQAQQEKERRDLAKRQKQDAKRAEYEARRAQALGDHKSKMAPVLGQISSLGEERAKLERDKLVHKENLEAVQQEMRKREHQARMKASIEQIPSAREDLIQRGAEERHKQNLKRVMSEIRPIEQIIVEKQIQNLKRQYLENDKDYTDLVRTRKLTDEKANELSRKQAILGADYREACAKLDYLKNPSEKEEYSIAVLRAKADRAKAEYHYFMDGIGAEKIPEEKRDMHERLERIKDETMIAAYDARLARNEEISAQDRSPFRRKKPLGLLNKAEVDEARKRMSAREKLDELLKPVGDPTKKPLFED